MAIEHKNLPDSELHEVKGAASATSGQVLIANGSGGATFQTLDNYIGFWDYDDTATASTPIALTVAGTYYPLTNDGLGPSTTPAYALSGVGNIWNTSTNQFDFSNLEIGDMVDFRLDVVSNTSGANNNMKYDLHLGIGSGSDFYIPFIDDTYKSASSHRATRWNSIYVGNSSIKNFPAKFEAKSDSTGNTVEVNGWYVRVIKRSLG